MKPNLEAGLRRRSRASNAHDAIKPRTTHSRRATTAIVPSKPRPETPWPEVVSFPGLQVRFQSSDSTVFLTGAVIAAATESGARRELIHRLFSITALKSLRLNWKKGEVRLEFTGVESPTQRLAQLAAAIQMPRPLALPLPHEELILRNDGAAAFRISRCATGLTLWHIDAPSNGIYRLIHPSLQNDCLRQHILEELATLPDVAARTIHLPLWGRDTLIVFVRPHHIGPNVFPEVLDPVLTRCLASGPPRHQPKTRETVVNVNLAIAPISDFVFPPLGVANVALMGVLGAANLPRGIAALRKGKLSLELLSTVIAALSVITMEFLPAALMYWLLKFWPQRATELYKLHHTRFVARYQLRPRHVWTERDGVLVETRVEELMPSSIVTLNAGDTVPGDGVIVGGSAQFDERLLTGNDPGPHKTEGSAIYASSRVVEGSVRMKIKTLGENTAAGRIAQWHRQALQRRDFKSRTVHQAEKMILPTMLVSALAYWQGGLAMTKATIRPDYATGPAVSEALGSLATIMNAANRGILLTGHAPLEKLSGPACVVFDDSVSWRKPKNGTPPFSELARNQGINETVFFGSGSENETGAVAATLGFDLFATNASAAAKRAYIAKKQSEGQVVIYVGNIGVEGEAASQADVAISVLEPPFAQVDKAHLALLSPDLFKFLELRALAAEELKENNTAFNISLAPNIAAVLAAFFFATPVYASVLLTNAGTFANYLVSEAKLHLAGAEALRR
jgi:hypothetical protein